MKQAIRNCCLNKQGKNDFWKDKGYNEYHKLNGLHFNCRAAEWACEQMVNANGSHAPKWTIHEVKNAFENSGFCLKNGYTWADVAYLANHLYSVLCRQLHSDSDAINMAYAITCDLYSYEGMIFNRWLADIMEKGVCVPWTSFL